MGAPTGVAERRATRVDSTVVALEDPGLAT